MRDLLFLAREDEDAAAGPQELVDLDDVVLEEAARARVTSSVEIRTAAVSAAPVRGNRERAGAADCATCSRTRCTTQRAGSSCR